MALGVRGANPIWSEVDLQGKQFDDTFWLWVLENTIPYIPATVYHNPDLTDPWTSPIQFLGNGTLPVDVYFESDKVYRLEFRQHIGLGAPTQADPLIYEVNNYVAGSGGSTPIDTVAFASSNQVTNPQFSLINFSSPLTVTGTNPDPIEIAPGWVLNAGGTGTVIVSQVALNNANTNPSNAPYAIRLQLNGWTADSVKLVQRFQQNGMLWASKTVSSSVTARLDGSPQNISAELFDSNNALLGSVLSSTAINESWNEFTGYSEIPATTNTDNPPSAYIEYRLSLPSNIDIYLTSFQLVVQELPLEPTFEQDSIERQVDHTFHYYRESLIIRPKDSILTGWDFRLNPWQFYARPLTTISSVGGYIADQTVLIAEVASSLQTSGSNTPAEGGSFVVKALNGVTQGRFALIQYIDPATCRPALVQTLSALVKARIVTTHGSQVGVKVKLLSSTTTPATVNQVTGWDADGPIFNPAIWDTSLPLNNPTRILTGNVVANLSDPLAFDRILPMAASSFASQTLALVVYTTAPMDNTLSSEDYISFQSISLAPNEFAIETNPKTFDETLRECQYYYQKSFLTDTLPATNVGLNTGEYRWYQIVSLLSAGTSPSIRFEPSMRAIPVMTLYNPAAANNQIRDITISANWSSSVATTNLNAKGFIASGTTANTSVATHVAAVHWTADARMGIV